jgi:hypothetical protein
MKSMNAKRTALFPICMSVLLAGPAAFGQAASVARTPPAPAAPAAPVITILAAATGALVRNHGASNASLDLGRVSYFQGTSAPGESSRKSSGSLVISTRFALKVDCPGSLPSSRVDVTMARVEAAASHAIAIDGTALESAAQTLVQAMPCGSSGEHRLDVEVPVSTPAGPIGSTVAFVAAIRR